jgi:hypothetical protein
MLHVRRKHPEEYERMSRMKESPRVDAASCAADNEQRQWCSCRGDALDCTLQFKTSHVQSAACGSTDSVLVAPKYRSATLPLGGPELTHGVDRPALADALACVPLCEYDKIMTSAASKAARSVIDELGGGDEVPLLFGVPLAFDRLLAPTVSTMWRPHTGCETFADAVALSLRAGSQVSVDAAVPGQLVCRINMRQTRIEWQYMSDTLDTGDIRRIAIPLSAVAAIGLTGLLDGSVVLTVQPTHDAKLSIERATRTAESWHWQSLAPLRDGERHYARFAAGALDLAWTALLACCKTARQLTAKPLADVYCGAPAAASSSTSGSRVSQM